MKRILSGLLAAMLLILCGCASNPPAAQLVCTTLPVYDFTARLCAGTDLVVTQLITENVSCLHDYTLKPTQMRVIEKADAVILSGAGLEDFLHDALADARHVINASDGLALHHAHDNHHDHSSDPHIWLSPANAMVMASNICSSLCTLYPDKESAFKENLVSLLAELEQLQTYGIAQLQPLSSRELITFHDGFSYMAEAFNLQIIKSVEEESGSEASAADLIEIIKLVQTRDIPAIFTENNGSTAAADIIVRETDVDCYALDMAISGDSYFEAMYHNINTLREALQ